MQVEERGLGKKVVGVSGEDEKECPEENERGDEVKRKTRN